MPSANRKTGYPGHRGRGWPPGGGLYVPEQVPALPEGFLKSLLPLDYPRRAAAVLSLWLPELADSLEDMCRRAYARFDDPAVAPVRSWGTISMCWSCGTGQPWP